MSQIGIKYKEPSYLIHYVLSILSIIKKFSPKKKEYSKLTVKSAKNKRLVYYEPDLTLKILCFWSNKFT
jgi:hypothetical protein